MVEFFYVLLGVIFAGYFALAGYNYGVGILLRVLGKTDTERRMVLGALGPFFLGNEVWLVAGLGLFLGAFPLAEGKVLSGLYPVLLPLIAAIVVFVAGVQLRSRTDKARPLWDVLIIGSGLVIAFGWGAAIGAVAQGFPIHFGPLPLVCGALTVSLFTVHGATLATLRTTGEIRQRGSRVVAGTGYASLVLVVLAVATAALDGKAIGNPIPAGLLVVMLATALLAAAALHRRAKPGWALVATGLAASLPLVIVGVGMLPYLYVHTDGADSLTLAQSASGESTLGLIMTLAVPVLPVLLLCQLATWWIWRRVPERPSFY